MTMMRVFADEAIQAHGQVSGVSVRKVYRAEYAWQGRASFAETVELG